MSHNRDTALREALLDRFRCEIQHMPGLALTPEQAARLFAVRNVRFASRDR